MLMNVARESSPQVRQPPKDGWPIQTYAGDWLQCVVHEFVVPVE